MTCVFLCSIVTSGKISFVKHARHCTKPQHKYDQKYNCTHALICISQYVMFIRHQYMSLILKESVYPFGSQRAGGR